MTSDQLPLAAFFFGFGAFFLAVLMIDTRVERRSVVVSHFSVPRSGGKLDRGFCYTRGRIRPRGRLSTNFTS
jgi:hypothetical protein